MKWRPEFIREIRDEAEAVGMLQATDNILRRDNISVTVNGNIPAINNHSGGILFVGNHNKQFEFVALMAVLAQMKRTRMKNIVKFYVEQQIDWALGDAGTDKVVSVYPRLLASDRRNKINLELGSRLLFRDSLQSLTESQRLNDLAIQNAAQELEEGGVVNIFPCGSIVNNMEKPWRAGVGRIMSAVAEDKRAEVLVVPYHADNLHRFRLAAAVAVRGQGPLARPQNIHVAFGVQQMISEFMQLVPHEHQSDPAALTDAVRQQYKQSFGAYQTYNG